jgi:hypothetical protein
MGKQGRHSQELPANIRTSPPTFSQMSAISLMKVIFMAAQSNKGATEIRSARILLRNLAGKSSVVPD